MRKPFDIELVDDSKIILHCIDGVKVCIPCVVKFDENWEQRVHININGHRMSLLKKDIMTNRWDILIRLFQISEVNPEHIMELQCVPAK